MIGLGASFLRARAGNIGVMAAIAAPILLAVAGLVIDYGSMILQKRGAQRHADLGAIVAAADLADPDRQLAKHFAANGLAYAIRRSDGYLLPGGAKVALDQLPSDMEGVAHVETGVYSADPSIAVAERFVAGAVPPNAVRVTIEEVPQTTFMPAALSGRHIAASGVSSTSATAAFDIGSRLVGLDGGVLNGILSGLTGSTVSLKLVDYQALASARVDLFQVSRQLATSLSLTGATYDDVLDSEITFGQFMAALRKSGGMNASSQAALQALQTATQKSTGTFALRKLISFGPHGGNKVDAPLPQEALTDVMHMVSASAALSNGKHQAEVALAVTIPGITGVTLSVAVGEPKQAAPLAGVGETGASVRTAQVRAKLIARVSGLSALLGLTVELPIYIEAADAEARLSRITCTGMSTTDGTVDLNVMTGIAQVAIGTVDPKTYSDFSASPAVTPAHLVSSALLKIDGKAFVNVGNTRPVALTFKPSEIAAKVTKTVSTSTIVGSLAGSLVKNLAVDIKVLGLGLSSPAVLHKALGDTLSAVAQPLDTLIYQVLTTLGISLGSADVSVTGVSCRGAKLVL